MPTSWSDVLLCECYECKLLAAIYRRCREFDEPRFVMDTRMHDPLYPWCVPVIDEVFVSPCPPERRFQSGRDAADSVLSVQRHCDVYESSWPNTPYRWRVVQIEATP